MLDFISRHKFILVAFILVLLALQILSWEIRAEHRAGFVTSLFFDATVFIQRGISESFSWVTGLWGRYVSLQGVDEENAILRKIIDELKWERMNLQEMAIENERLRSLLNFKREVSTNLLPARVIGEDPSGWSQIVIIDRGSSDGISEGMAVVTADGIVGQIHYSSRQGSKVLLVIDPTSEVGSIVQETRTRGIVEGLARDSCLLKYVQRHQEIARGDRVVTSGLDGIFPKGLHVGTVSFVDGQLEGLFQYVEIKPFVDFNKLEEVFVVMTRPDEEGGSVAGE